MLEFINKKFRSHWSESIIDYLQMTDELEGLRPPHADHRQECKTIQLANGHNLLIARETLTLLDDDKSILLPPTFVIIYL